MGSEIGRESPCVAEEQPWYSDEVESQSCGKPDVKSEASASRLSDVFGGRSRLPDDNGPLVDAKCNKCGAPTKGYKNLIEFFGGVICKRCSDDWDRRHGVVPQQDHVAGRREAEWEEMCPLAYKLTDWAHPVFKATWQKTARWREEDEKRSIIIQGPSGSAKTRCMVELLKSRYRAGDNVLFVWAEDLREAATTHQSRYKTMRQWADVKWLGLDDPLLAGAADERVVTFVKELLDMRMRRCNRFVITTQVDGDGVSEAANSYHNTTASSREQVNALIRRLRETCFVARVNNQPHE